MTAATRSTYDAAGEVPNPDRLKIAFLADTIEGQLGGGVVAARAAVAALRARHDVVVASADATDAGDVRLPGFVLPLRAMREMQFVMAQPRREALARALAGAHVLHLQFPFWLSMTAIGEARRAGIPIVAAFHVQPENALLNLGIRSRWLTRAVYRLFVDGVFNRVDAVVCPTRFAHRKLLEHGLRVPGFVISNGVPPDVLPVAASREAEFRGKFLIVCVGRLAAEKGQEVVIEAIRRSAHRDRIALVLAGGGPRERQLRALAASLPNPPTIGFLPRERLLRFLGTADLMVHASEVELEGIAVLEAMRAGLPSLIAQSAESAASEFAIGEDFAFPAGDAAALAARIDALVENPLKLAQARRRVTAASTAFPFAASVEALERVYRSVIEKRADARAG